MGREISKLHTPRSCPFNSVSVSPSVSVSLSKCHSALLSAVVCSTCPLQPLRGANSWPDSSRSIHSTITAWPTYGTATAPGNQTPLSLSPSLSAILSLSNYQGGFVSDPSLDLLPLLSPATLSSISHHFPFYFRSSLIHLRAPVSPFPPSLKYPLYHFTLSSLISCHLVQMKVSGQ